MEPRFETDAAGRVYVWEGRERIRVWRRIAHLNGGRGGFGDVTRTGRKYAGHVEFIINLPCLATWIHTGNTWAKPYDENDVFQVTPQMLDDQGLGVHTVTPDAVLTAGRAWVERQRIEEIDGVPYHVLSASSWKLLLFNDRGMVTMSTQVQPSGETVLSTPLDRPLRGLPVVPEDLLYQRELLPTSLQDTGHCVIVGLLESQTVSALTPDVIGALDDICYELYGAPPHFQYVAMIKRRCPMKLSDVARAAPGLRRLRQGVVEFIRASEHLRIVGDTVEAVDAPYRYTAPYEDGSWRELGITMNMLGLFCTRRGQEVYVMHRDRLIKHFVPRWKVQTKPLCVAVWGPHCFFYGPKAHARIASMSQTALDAPRPMLLPPVHERAKLYSDMIELTTPRDLLAALERKQPGVYRTDDVQEVSDFLRAQGITHHPEYRRVGKMRSLVIYFSRRDPGFLRVLQVPERHAELQRFSEEFEATGLHLPYRAEGLPMLMYKAVAELLVKRRRALHKGEYERLLEHQGGSCLICGKAFSSRLQAHHPTPLCQGGSELVLLCVRCHRDETERQRQAQVLERREPFESELSPHMSRVLHLSKPRQCVCGDGPDETALCVDIKSCRRNALVQSAYDLPVLDVSCDMEEIRDENDFWAFYLEGDYPLPYEGPKLYGRVVLDYLREITDVRPRYGVRYGQRLAPSVLREAFETIEACAGRSGLEPKECVLSLIGVWGRHEHWKVRVDETGFSSDAPGATRRTTDGRRTFLETRTQQFSNRSCLPIHLMALWAEVTNMARCRSLAESLVYRPMGELIDGLYFAPNELPAELLSWMEGQRYGDGTPVWQIKGHQGRNIPSCPRALPQHWPWAPRDWTHLTDELDAAQLAMRVIDNGGAYITGMPGTGKSSVIREIVAELRRTGQQVEVVALTHCAADLIDGRTIEEFLHRHQQYYCGWLIVDESSQVPLFTWTKLLNYLPLGVRLVIAGDPVGQLQPVLDGWTRRGIVEETYGFRDACRFLKVTMLKQRRCEEEVVRWVRPLYEGLPISVPYDRFPVTQRDPLYLCISHRKRVALNQYLQDRSGLYLPKGTRLPGTCEPQDMWLRPGDRVMGVRSPLLRNNCFYIVEGCDPITIRIETGTHLVTLTPQQAAEYLRPMKAAVYFVTQGRTIHGEVVLLDTAHPHFTQQTLNVGMTRVTLAAHLGIMRPEQEADLMRRKRVRSD